ncbi:hypothetical protein FRB98_006677 [Tulasnella sp. 332]|nr:hypothetical protein FRB98_006677 [Tulasnella sp. 332]
MLSVFSSSSSTMTTSVEAVPTISIVQPTPAKRFGTLDGHVHQSVDKPTPTQTRQSQSHRLLYKGALTLSDDHTDVSLEGICFVAHLPPTSPTSFLNSPLPLALESMHGRPSLRITSIIPLASVAERLDDASDVRLYWHPDASYLANEFFMSVVWKLGGWDQHTGRSNRCVKIALGDEDISEENELIIYGQCPPSTPTVTFMAPSPGRSATPTYVTSNDQLTSPIFLSLLANVPTRILGPNSIYGSPGRKGAKRLLSVRDTSPERASDRLKKKGKIALPPDRTTGRTPFSRTQTMPTLVFGGGGGGRAGNRATSPAFINNGALLQAMGSIRRSGSGDSHSNGRGAMMRSHSRGSSVSSAVAVEDDVFKVPEPVIQSQSQSRHRMIGGGGGGESSIASAPSGKEKEEISELETTNKNAIKRQTTSVLASHGVPKDHPEFRDIYNWVQRGVAFALRKSINVKRLERDQMKALVTKHVEMYMDEPVASLVDPNAMDLG